MLLEGDKVLALAGIANPDGFFQHLETKFSVQKSFRFADHHSYTTSDFSPIMQRLFGEGDLKLIMTEKDAVKLRPLMMPEDALSGRIFYLPIEVRMKGELDSLSARVRAHIDRFEGLGGKSR